MPLFNSKNWIKLRRLPRKPKNEQKQLSKSCEKYRRVLTSYWLRRGELRSSSLDSQREASQDKEDGATALMYTLWRKHNDFDSEASQLIVNFMSLKEEENRTNEQVLRDQPRDVTLVTEPNSEENAASD
ncbi:hypothetical protein PanWU01x14_030390 [Parasponia andersonii]|uniref:Uncharacterized protein n=1 Tax=Parasponia andersonii TaxID=3476 RepID=A0A2P5DUR0_PARAD|nr:hypothetical protein PanWU01x14_030390 [Parasponia andersonii]